jgi:hypothetical protein
MWDPKDRLDADMQYAIRMVVTHGTSLEQAAQMCGVEVGALRAEIARLAPGEHAGAAKAAQRKPRRVRDAS